MGQGSVERKNCGEKKVKFIWKRLKKYRLPLAAAFVMLVLSTVCSVALPTLMTNIVDYGIGEKDLHYVFRTAGIMAGVAIADALLVVAAYWLETKALEAFGRDLRAEIFRKATSLSPDEFAKFGAGGLITRSIEDADRVGEVVYTLMSALSAIPFTMIFGTVLAFRRDPLLALILFAFVPVLIAVVLPVSRKVHPLWKTSDEYMDKQNALVRSRLSGIRVVRAFNREGAEQEKIASATRVMADNIIRANVRAGLISPVCMFLLNFATVLILAWAPSAFPCPPLR